jgi:hypothetical protein
LREKRTPATSKTPSLKSYSENFILNWLLASEMAQQKKNDIVANYHKVMQPL